MLELFFNTETKAITQSPNGIAEFILPPFYAGESRLIRFHTMKPSADPLNPDEIKPTSVSISLCGKAPGVAINVNLSSVAEEDYFEGTMTIPRDTALMPAGETTQALFFGGAVLVDDDRIFFEKNVYLNIPYMSANAQTTTFTKTLTAGDDGNIEIDYSSMELAAPPTYIRIDNAVQKTAPGQANIYASLLVETITETSAYVELNAPCDVTGRTFNFTVIP